MSGPRFAEPIARPPAPDPAQPTTRDPALTEAPDPAVQSGPPAYKPVAPTAWGGPRYYGIDFPDEVAHQMMLEGLDARGPNLSLLEHSLGADDRAFRGSTTVAITPDGQQGAGAWAGDGGWIFEIDGTPTWNLEQLFEGRVRRIDGSYGGVAMPGEIEHAFLAEVPSGRIIAIQKIVEVDGVMKRGERIVNPNHVKPGGR